MPPSSPAPELLMPRATAVWLVDNTALTFAQIADFCSLHELEVQAIANDETGAGIKGYDPVVHNQLTADEIKRCEADPDAVLVRMKTDLPTPTRRTKGPRYTPVNKRSDKPNAVAWLVKHYPDMKDGTIGRLIGTTKNTITAVRERSHWNMANISAKHPVMLELCTQDDLNAAIKKAGGEPASVSEQITGIDEMP